MKLLLLFRQKLNYNIMRKFIYLSAMAIFVASCNCSTSAKIDAKVEGLSQKDVIIKVLNISTLSTIDTVKTDEDGVFRYRIKKLTATPEFYYIYYKDKQIASMILKAGDKVHLMTDTTGNSPKIDGSPESLLLEDIESDIRNTEFAFDSLSKVYNQAIIDKNKILSDSINLQLGKLYVKQKQRAIKHIFKNPKSFTNIILIYEMFPGNLPLFADLKDAMIINRIHDSLKIIYPDSRYLPILEKEASDRLKADELNFKIENSKITTIPEICLPDVNAHLQSLNALKGKVIILSVWTITNVDQKMYNQELIDLYHKYNSKGLEIYQVSVDGDKTTWGRLVVDQKIPWISVCDGLGSNSPAVSTYNVSQIPTNFIINKAGDIVAKNIFSIPALESKIKSLL